MTIIAYFYLNQFASYMVSDHFYINYVISNKDL